MENRGISFILSLFGIDDLLFSGHQEIVTGQREGIIS